MKLLVQSFAVAGGGAAGAVVRFLVTGLFARLLRTDFPVGTLVINLTGSMLLGWFLASAGGRVSDAVRLAVATGFVGAYTTFSTYTYEADALLGNGQGVKAVVYLVGSVVLGLLAVRLGIYMGGR